MHHQRLVDEYRGCVENGGNERGVTTLGTEGTQMGHISSGTLSGDLHQVLDNPNQKFLHGFSSRRLGCQ
jgi:hypothetical protein